MGRIIRADWTMRESSLLKRLEHQGVSRMRNHMAEHVDLFISLPDPGVRGILMDWLSSADDINITEKVEPPGPGEQGALTDIAVSGAASAVITAIRVLPEFIRSQKTPLIIRVKSERGKFKRAVEIRAEDTTAQAATLINQVIAELAEPTDD
jgi:hypothetical protein